jgi:hypothetical protein
MSAAAEHFRALGLKRQVAAHMREAGGLWLSIQVAYGMGGLPPQGAEYRLACLVSEAERLTLEWQTAL